MIVGQVCRHVVALVVVAQSGRGDLKVDGCRCGMLCVSSDVVTARVTGWGRTAGWRRREGLRQPPCVR